MVSFFIGNKVRGMVDKYLMYNDVKYAYKISKNKYASKLMARIRLYFMNKKIMRTIV